MDNIIMVNAHEMVREAVRRHPGADYKATFSAALREAWLDYKINAKPITTAAEEFAALDGAELYKRLLAMVYHCRRRDGSIRSGKTGDFIPPIFSSIPAADNEAILNEAYTITAETVSGGTDSTLSCVMYYAVIRAAARIRRKEQAEPRAIRTATDSDGREINLIDTAAGRVDRASVSPEEYAGVRDAIARAARDDKDMEIIRLRLMGYNQADIGQRIGLCQHAVSVRLAAMAERYRQA